MQLVFELVAAIVLIRVAVSVILFVFVVICEGLSSL